MKFSGKKTLKQIGAISSVTFHELLREKILWSAFVFAILCVALAFAVSQLSFADNARIALDFGLTSISIVGGLISVIMGAALIAREVQNRTLYLVLTKSIGRWQFVLGRAAGLLGVITVNALVMTVALLVVYFLAGGTMSSAIVKSLLLQITEFGLLASVACIFSAFSTSTMAAIFASGIWIIGHAMTDFEILIRKMEPAALRPVFNFVAQLLPDLTRLDIKAEVSHGLPVTWAYTAASIGYGAAYIAFALVAACLIFSRRDL